MIKALLSRTKVALSPIFRQRGLFIFSALAVGLSLTVGGCALQQTPSSDWGAHLPMLGTSSPAEEANQVYEEAWRTVLHEYVDPTFNGQDWYQWKDHFKGLLQDKQDAYVAIATMLASLNDEYTRFLPPRDMNEQSMSIDSKLYGIGVQIFVKDHKLVVVTALEGTPAAKANIQANDVITHINGESTAGMAVEDAADRIRGKEGTLVKLTIKRGEKMLTVELPRAEIKVKSVFTKAVSDQKIGYIQLNSFISEQALKEMQDAVSKMKGKQALIIDLRGNYGGLLTNAVEIADMFLDNGEIVSIVDRQKERLAYDATRGQAFKKPVVLLINGGSASASEILSGALKDHHRATLIGTKTFGKGLVQKINPMEDGSGINITISKYFTPNGTDINKKGIQPDIKVPFTEKDFRASKDPQLETAIQFLEKGKEMVAQTR